MADAFALWRVLLADPASNVNRDGASLNGFWRIIGARTKTDWPVAVWTDDAGKTWLRYGRGEAKPHSSQDFADFEIAIHKAVAVEHGVYLLALENGEWPDGKPARSKKKPGAISTPAAAAEVSAFDTPDEGKPEAAAFPSNQPAALSELEDQIDSLADLADEIETVSDQATANRAQGIVDRMRGLWKSADGKRADEKRPIDHAAAAVQARWKPMLDKAADAGGKLQHKVKRFLATEEARIKVAEVLRLEAEKAARMRQETESSPGDGGHQTDRSSVTRLTQQPKAQARSEFGRAGALRNVKVGVIVDREKFIRAISKRTDFDEYLNGVAQQLARAGVETKGLEIRVERR